MIEIRSSTSAPGGSIGNGNGSGFAFACGFAQWAAPSPVALRRDKPARLTPGLRTRGEGRGEGEVGAASL